MIFLLLYWLIFILIMYSINIADYKIFLLLHPMDRVRDFHDKSHHHQHHHKSSNTAARRLCTDTSATKPTIEFVKRKICASLY